MQINKSPLATRLEYHTSQVRIDWCSIIFLLFYLRVVAFKCLHFFPSVQLVHLLATRTVKYKLARSRYRSSFEEYEWMVLVSVRKQSASSWRGRYYRNYGR